MTENSYYFAWSYPAQKFSESMHSLAVHFGPNWERMTFAIMPLTLLRRDDFPDADLFNRTEALVRRATKRGPMSIGNKQLYGSIEHTMRRSKKSTFEKLAREIWDIDEQIELRRGPYIP